MVPHGAVVVERLLESVPLGERDAYEREGLDAGRCRDRHVETDDSAQRIAHDMHLARAEGVEQAQDPRGAHTRRVRPRAGFVHRRTAVPGEVDRHDPVPRGEYLGNVPPVRDPSPEFVQQDDHRCIGIAHGPGPDRMLDAAGVGIEVAVRLGMGGFDEELGNSEFFERGQHATSICGAVGAAVAAAMVYGLDEEGIGHAAGIAASMGSGLLEANRTGGTVKRAHCGWAAHAGVTAAELAQGGLTGPPTVVEGRFGFLYAFCGERADVDKVTDRLGEHWELPGIFFKPYPCNHFTHAGIDAALELRARGISPEQVDAIELGVPGPVLRTIAQPTEDKARPKSGYHAAFSGPYTVAAALCGGSGLGVGHADFTDTAAADEQRLALAAKVTCVADEKADSIYPYQFPAVLRVTTTGGAVHEVRIDVNRGGPGNPLSADELITKFELNAVHVLGESARDIATQALGLSRGGDLQALMERLRD